jgi:hypothetical protein
LSEIAVAPIAAVESDAHVIAATRKWLEKVVIGLGLCPFAAAVHARKQIHFSVSAKQTTDGLLEDLIRELRELQEADPQHRETSLLIHPQALTNFDDYNQFLDEADAVVRSLGLEGELQIASFHPQYQFADSELDAIENYSNRSPYPMLHLLREASVTRAVETYPDIDAIADNNIATLRSLGNEGLRRLWLD